MFTRKESQHEKIMLTYREPFITGKPSQRKIHERVDMQNRLRYLKSRETQHNV